MGIGNQEQATHMESFLHILWRFLGAAIFLLLICRAGMDGNVRPSGGYFARMSFTTGPSFMADEIELKLELSPADADRIAASKLFGETEKVAQQVSTYFDTAGKRSGQGGLLASHPAYGRHAHPDDQG